MHSYNLPLNAFTYVCIHCGPSLAEFLFMSKGLFVVCLVLDLLDMVKV
jgi:hypothetical protein